MALPGTNPTYQYLDSTAQDGTILGYSATAGKIGFWNTAPIVQPTSSAQAALTLTTSLSSGFGFTTSAGFNAFIAQLENIRASLVLMGLLKGS